MFMLMYVTLRFCAFGFPEFCPLFLFVCLCRPTLFSFQCHVIAIVTLACTLLSHHWSMLAGR